MKILITGGGGFIGSNLCEYLVNKGHSIVVIDNLSTGYEANLSRVINVIEFHCKNLEQFDLKSLLGIDVVVHLAAQASVPISINNFGASSSSNLMGTIKIIDFCRINNIPVVYASSSAIYGNMKLGNDDTDLVDLLSPYAIDKYMMELYMKNAFQLYNFSSIGLRFFNVYGPKQDASNPYSGVISIFVDRLLRGKNITINGGYQTRDFVYIMDVVDAIYKSINLVYSQNICEQINVLSGNSISIESLANSLISKTSAEVEKFYADLPIGDPKESNGTIRKMKDVLNFEFSSITKIENGLENTIKYISGDKI